MYLQVIEKVNSQTKPNITVVNSTYIGIRWNSSFK